jgi:hypothetical protein
MATILNKSEVTTEQVALLESLGHEVILITTPYQVWDSVALHRAARLNTETASLRNLDWDQCHEVAVAVYNGLRSHRLNENIEAISFFFKEVSNSH